MFNLRNNCGDESAQKQRCVFTKSPQTTKLCFVSTSLLNNIYAKLILCRSIQAMTIWMGRVKDHGAVIIQAPEKVVDLCESEEEEELQEEM